MSRIADISWYGKIDANDPETTFYNVCYPALSEVKQTPGRL